jgi:hypothetical protein
MENGRFAEKVKRQQLQGGEEWRVAKLAPHWHSSTAYTNWQTWPRVTPLAAREQKAGGRFGGYRLK